MSHIERKVIIKEKYGLYLDAHPNSPLSKIVLMAQKFDAQIQIKAKGKTIDLKVKIPPLFMQMMLASLGLNYDDEITICADGIDAQYAVKALAALIESNFDEDKARRETLDKTQFTMLGMKGSGKTCYMLGMYNEMLGGMKGFTLTTDDDNDVKLQRMYDIMDDPARGQGRFPAGTDQTESYEFQLEHGYSPIMSFDWYDYSGNMLNEKTSWSNPEEYKELEKKIQESSCLFICADGALLQGDDDNNTKARLLKRNCSRFINPFLSHYQKNNKVLPPTAIIITKSDLCRNDTSSDDLREIIEEAFNPLFEKAAELNRFVAVIPVSLGSNISENGYTAMLNPKGIQLPIFMGIWFALELYKIFARNDVIRLEREQRGLENDRDEEKDKWFSFFRTDDNKVNRLNRQAREKLEERLSINKRIEAASENQRKLMSDLEKNVALVYFNGTSYESFPDAAAKYIDTRR